jgi:hypothetical protein
MSALHTLLRLLFPSWAFFDTAGAPPVLEVRTHSANDRSSNQSRDSWQPVVQPPVRRPWHVLFNPGGTQALAEQTVVERWHSEIEEEAETDVTRALVEGLVAAYVAERGPTRSDVSCQYRLCVGYATSPDDDIRKDVDRGIDGDPTRDGETLVLRTLGS